MATDFSVKFNFTADELINKIKTKSQVKKVAKLLLKEIKLNTSKGISSVAGGSRRLQKYKDPDKYPANRKKARPVNLYLTGQMMKALTTQVVIEEDSFGINVFFNNLTETEKYITHHYGLHGVPSRKIIPIDDGEEFSKKVNRYIRNLFNDLIQRGIKRINRGGN